MYYEATICGGEVGALDPEEILDIQFVSADQVRQRLKYRAWIIPLETWMRDHQTAYHYFDVVAEGFEI